MGHFLVQRIQVATCCTSLTCVLSLRDFCLQLLILLALLQFTYPPVVSVHLLMMLYCETEDED